MIEEINGKAQMAYTGETPWHGLGTKVPADLTPIQMLEAAGLDWTVEKVPARVTIAGEDINIGKSALVRSVDNSILDVVTDDWNTIQNEEAFEFFNDFVMAGDMSMETAGSLRNGQIVWGLAKVNESFDLFKGKDQINSYLHFTNFHRFGFATDVRLTPIRVVCNNTLTLSLNQKVENMVKISHRKKFDAENVKVMLGVAHDKMLKYKDMAQYLCTKRYNGDNIVEYFKSVFPLNRPKEDTKKEISKNARDALVYINTQPGAELGEGTWWQAFNTVTYMTDHTLGRSADTRLQSAWYGGNKNLKIKALETAVEFANAV